MCTIEVERLDELYEKLPNIPHFSDILRRCKGKIYEYQVEDGKFESTSIFDTPDISIAKSYITKGTKVGIHDHDGSYEIIIIIDGILAIDFGTHKKVLGKGESLKIDKYEPHAAFAVTDCVFVAITVPKDNGFPT